MAGLFDSASIAQVAQALVPAADWLRIRVLLPDCPLLDHPGDVSSHKMTLDMKRGVLLSESHYSSTPNLVLHVKTLRLVSRSDRAVGMHMIQVEVERGEMDVTLEAWAKGTDLGLAIDRLEQNLGGWHNRHSGKRLAMATQPALHIDGQRGATPRRPEAIKGLLT